MLNVIEELILDINELHINFHSNGDNQIKHHINFSKRQINHLYIENKLSNDFFSYVTAYKHAMSRLMNSIDADDLIDNYNSLRLRMRIKEWSSLEEKIERHNNGPTEGKIPIQKCINDIFGLRIISDKDYRNHKDFDQMCERLKKEKVIFRYYTRNDDEYHGIHLYFKGKSNLYLPWELQIWYDGHEENNYQSHHQHKQGYLKRGE